ncbi:uncharacterized protein [Procambarus clarkii]|uniref:uncharacterized protein n=1 Tax=Procambarus clarkii TaxID=6728 RepID=UPI003743AEC7
MYLRVTLLTYVAVCLVAVLGQPRSGGTTPYGGQTLGSAPLPSGQKVGGVPSASPDTSAQGVGGSLASNQIFDGFGQLGSGPRVSAGSSGSVVGAGQGLGSGQRVAAGSSSGPASYAGPRYGSPQVSRVDAVFHPTVTQLVTVDRFVTLTDQAFQSVAVTLTSLTVQTVTTGTRGVLQTPVDDRVALQTTVVVKPSTLTVTHVQSDFRIVTERSLDYVTIAHTSYIIVQTTYTTTATQVLSYTTTLVRTNINTKSTAFTDYRTITDTVLVPGGYYGNRQF